jgi:hypothetical protein
MIAPGTTYREGEGVCCQSNGHNVGCHLCLDAIYVQSLHRARKQQERGYHGPFWTVSTLLCLGLIDPRPRLALNYPDRPESVHHAMADWVENNRITRAQTPQTHGGIARISIGPLDVSPLEDIQDVGADVTRSRGHTFLRAVTSQASPGS